jgi:hypothetical protein
LGTVEGAGLAGGEAVAAEESRVVSAILAVAIGVGIAIGRVKSLRLLNPA